MKTIVLGLDGSSEAKRATRWTAAIAAATGAEVVAVHAIPPSELWLMAAFQIDAEPIVADVQRELEGAWTAPLREAGIRCRTLLLHGDPAAELLRVVRDTEATLLVLGAMGHGAVHELVVGGPAHKIINRCPVPVVLVPPGAQAARAA
jgi:nucleotide-binding universal stress UspA family protein